MAGTRQWLLRKGSKPSGFRYERPDGTTVRDNRTVERINALRIPPAWRDVHIASSRGATIQAWGMDARGRKQYRYHARAVAQGELRKYHRVRQLAHDLPRIRERLHADRVRRDLTRDKVAAGVVQLIAEGLLRIGSERYERENRTYGITTLRKSHVEVVDGRVVFSYTGKRAIRQKQVVPSAEMARFVRAMLKVPGRRLFRYRNGKQWCDLQARDVNDYLQEIAGVAYTAKDFRTWGATLRFATILSDLGPAPGERQAKSNVMTALRLVAAELGNTPVICRKSYVHPMVIARYLDDGETIRPPRRPGSRSPIAHAPEERALIRFLERHFPERRSEPRE
jgi:DNA topoisomerase-1